MLATLATGHSTNFAISLSTQPRRLFSIARLERRSPLIPHPPAKAPPRLLKRPYLLDKAMISSL